MSPIVETWAEAVDHVESRRRRFAMTEITGGELFARALQAEGIAGGCPGDLVDCRIEAKRCADAILVEQQGGRLGDGGTAAIERIALVVELALMELLQ